MAVDQYGVFETNNLKETGINQQDFTNYIDFYALTKDMKIEAVRFRMLSDYGFPLWDISYLYVKIDGKPYSVTGGQIGMMGQLSKKKWKSQVIEECKKQGVFIKNILDPTVVSQMQ